MESLSLVKFFQKRLLNDYFAYSQILYIYLISPNMYIGRTYYSPLCPSRFRDYRSNSVIPDRSHDHRYIGRDEYRRRLPKKSYEFKSYFRPEIRSNEPRRGIRRLRTPTLPRRRRRRSLSPPISRKKAPLSYKRSNETPLKKQSKSSSASSRKTTSKRKIQRRLSSREPNKRSKESPPRSKKESSPKLFSSDELSSPEELPVNADLELSPTENLCPKLESPRRRRRKRRLLRKIAAISSTLYQKVPWRNQEVVFFNYEIESRFAEVLTSFMIGRRKVMSQKQICQLANYLMTLKCSLVDEEWYFIVENSSLNIEWLKKFISRHLRIAQFVDGMNGNWFWRKNILTESELSECTTLCKRCLNLKLPSE